MFGFRAGFLEDGAGERNDDRIRSDDQRGLAEFLIVDFGFVDGLALLRCGLQDVFEGREGLGEVFGGGGGDNFDVCETDLREQLFSSWGGRGEDYSFAAEGG